MYVLLSCYGNSTLHLHYISGTGPADVPQDGGDDEAHVEVTGQDDHVEEAALSPQGHRSVDYKTSKCEDRSWTSSSQQRWSVLGFTQYGSSCLEKDDDDFKNLSASLYLCAAELVQRQSAHTRVQQPASRQLNQGSRNIPYYR